MAGFSLLLFFAGLLGLSLGLTRLMMVLGPKWGLVDQPDARRIHQGVIPRAGGLAVFATLAIGFAVLWVAEAGFDGPLGGRWLGSFSAAAFLLVAAGVIDDRRGLSAWTKLGVQVAAASLMFFYSGSEIGLVLGFDVPWAVDLALNVAWMVALINAYNLIDGMDGLCAGLGLISVMILGLLTAVGGHPGNALVIGVMGVALAGFLRYNFYPARIFLGDAGSMLIGFFIASVGSATVGRHAVTSGVLLPLLVAGVPLFDVVLAVWRRYARKLAQTGPMKNAPRVFGPDKDHLHHRFLRSGLSQRQAVGVMYGLAVLVAVVALIPMMGGANLMALSVMAMMVVFLIGLHYIAPVEFVESGRGIRAMIRRPRHFRVVVCMYFLFDVAAAGLAMTAALWLITKENEGVFRWAEQQSTVAIFTACTVAALAMGGAHLRRWMRAGVNDFMACSLWLTAGAGVSAGILGAMQVEDFYRILLSHLCALMAAGWAVFAFRAAGLSLLEGVVDSMHRRRRLPTEASPRKTLLYGAGDLGELFVCNLLLSPPEQWKDYRFLGFVDDAEEFKGRRLRGFPILGPSRELSHIAKKTGATVLVVTLSRLSDEQWKQLEALCASCALELYRWTPNLHPVPAGTAAEAEGAGKTEWTKAAAVWAEPAREIPADFLPQGLAVERNS